MPDAASRAAMLMKELCSYPWVRETYGDAPARPAAGWRAARAARPHAAARRPVPARERGAVDYEQAGELKIGQVGIANLRVRTLDVAQLVAEMRERVQRAPKLFARAAVILDFGGLQQTPDVATARALLDGLREAGVLPVALAYGTQRDRGARRALGLPLLAKFRAQYERADDAPAAAAAARRARRRSRAAPPNPRRAAAAAATAAPARA